MRQTFGNMLLAFMVISLITVTADVVMGDTAKLKLCVLSINRWRKQFDLKVHIKILLQ